MKTINDIKLELRIADRIKELVDRACAGDLQAMDDSDQAGLFQAAAMSIMNDVRSSQQ